MDASPDADFPITLQAIQLLEYKALAIHDHQELVRYFCLQVIPFLAESSQLSPLWEELRFKYESLYAEYESHEKKAIAEIKRAFKRVEIALKGSPSIPKELQDCLEMARMTILKNHLPYVTHPIFRVYDEEFRNLLRALLKAGYQEICEAHAELIELDEYIQKDPDEKERWALLNKEGRVEKIIPADAVKESDKHNNSRLFCIHPEKILVQVPHIRLYTFAPSTLKAWDALNQIQWSHYDNPAVIWKYFQAAISCWNTPRSYFSKKITPPKTAKETLKFWQQSAEHSAWSEIAHAKEKSPANERIVIFTSEFFKKGFSTLVNVIAGFLTQKEQSPPVITDSRQKVSLELFMHKGQLWISMDSFLGTKKFCVQKFNDSGYSDGSEPEKFSKKLVSAPPNTNGEPYQIDFENVAHVLDRLKLPKQLKKSYFSSTCGDTVHYAGPKLGLQQEVADIKLLSDELQHVHDSNRSPIFTSSKL